LLGLNVVCHQARSLNGEEFSAITSMASWIPLLIMKLWRLVDDVNVLLFLTLD
jgi:hypothetical protein